jgi:apolipoprotein N-acyltransferase
MLSHTFGAGSDIYNSAVLFSASGQVMGRYDKNHLVPFAEQIPLADRYPAQAAELRKQLHDFPQITPGTAQTLLVDEELRVGPVICSEDIEMEYVHQLARLKPNLLAAVISDGWFGESAAPHQHLALAAFRAIETRRDFVRSTNTGVSAIIDAVGRVTLEGPLYGLPVDQPRAQMTLLVGQVALLEIPAAAPYTARYFPYIGLLALAVGLIAQVSINRRRAGKSKKGKKG